MSRDWTHAEQESTCWVPIRGDSMWPSLRSGDVAGVEPLVEAPRPGEVVVARFAQELVVHRVVRCEADTCVLRGDNVLTEDPSLPRAKLLGRVSQVRRGGEVLARARWDVGPRRLGRWRVAVKRRLAALLGRKGTARLEARVCFREDSIPHRREGADGQRFGEDFVVVDPQGHMLRCLNETAARIWELVDGQRSARDIAGELAREYDVEQERVLGDCLRLLEQLAGFGLLDAKEVLP